MPFGTDATFAFPAAVLSVLFDLDASISPNARWEKICHSSQAVIFGILLTTVGMVFVPSPVTVTPLLALMMHILLDLFGGEAFPRDPVFGRLEPGHCYHPRLVRGVELLSLPLSLVVMI